MLQKKPWLHLAQNWSFSLHTGQYGSIANSSYQEYSPHFSQKNLWPSGVSSFVISVPHSQHNLRIMASPLFLWLGVKPKHFPVLPTCVAFLNFCRSNQEQQLLPLLRSFLALNHSFINPLAHPIPEMTESAPAGQFLLQAPHSMHASRSSIRANPLSRPNTWCGQTSTHLPQPVQTS